MRSPSLSAMLVAGLTAASSSSTRTSAFTITPSTCFPTAASITSANNIEAVRHASSPSSPTASRHSCMLVAEARSAVSLERRPRAVTAAPLRMSTAAEGASPAAAVEETAPSVDIPTKLPSECGIDYVPLATMLATGDLKGADQFTRDALIKAAGAGSQKRAFVYWTEVKKIPNTDLATMENLWLKYSKGKFGYSVQKDVWRRSKGDFEIFCRRLGWTTQDSEVERKLRWFGANEFIYDVDRAPKGHLPLTSALRGTTLLKELMMHPVWETEWQWEK